MQKSKGAKPHSPKILAAHAQNVSVFGYVSGADYLERLHSEVQAAQGRYSYRAFAEDLGFEATNYLHLLCRRTRRLAVAAAKRIADALALEPGARRYFILLARYDSARSSAEREVIFEEIMELKGASIEGALGRDQLAYFSQWYHAAVREMVHMPGFTPDPAWLAARLLPRVTPEEARNSWELLVRIGYVTQSEEDGRWTQADVRVSTPHGARAHAVIRYHQKMAELGKECVTRVTVSRRDVSALTLPMTPELFEELKACIGRWKADALARGEALPACRDIYQLNIQLFPLTEGDDA